MSEWAAIVTAGATSVLSVLLVRVVARLLSRQRPVLTLPMESGFEPPEHALSRFHARWYPLTLLFLAFDVEMLFMYPWALVVESMGRSAIIEMFAFLGVLLVGVVWAWREGALRWM